MNIERMIRAMLFTPGPGGNWGVNLLIEGPPGSAKSSLVRSVAHKSGLNVETIIASTRAPEDFAGLPFPSAKGSYIERLVDRWIQNLLDADGGVAFIDEFNTAPSAVQAATLRVTFERKAGDQSLPKRARVIAAQNAVGDAADGHDIPAPAANRFIHLSWAGPALDDWHDWILGGAEVIENDTECKGIAEAKAEEARVMQFWPDAFARARGLVVGFTRSLPGEVYRQPKAGDPQSSKAWASWRSWELAFRALAGSEVHGLPAEESERLLAGAVGDAAAIKFLRFIADADMPVIADVLDGKVKFTPDHRQDRTVAVYASCAALVADPGADKTLLKTRLPRMWKLLDSQLGHAADLTIPAARTLVAHKLQTGVPESSKVMLALHPIMEAAGLLRR